MRSRAPGRWAAWLEGSSRPASRRPATSEPCCRWWLRCKPCAPGSCAPASRATGRTPEPHADRRMRRTGPRSGLHVLAGSAYLQRLAALVLLGTLAAIFIDYVFMVQVKATFEEGPALGRFFSLYYATISLVAFIVQTFGSRLVLERLGLGAAASAPASRGGRGRGRQLLRAGLQQHRDGSRQRGGLPKGRCSAPAMNCSTRRSRPATNAPSRPSSMSARTVPGTSSARSSSRDAALAAWRTPMPRVAWARRRLLARRAGRRTPTDPRIRHGSRTEPARSQRGGRPLGHRGCDDPHGGPAHAPPREAGSRHHPGRGSRGPRRSSRCIRATPTRSAPC